MFKGEASSTNFDDDPEEGEVRSSPQKAVVEDADITINITKDTEIHIADGVIIDRTESIEIEAHETSGNDVSNSEWYNSLRRGMLDNSVIANKEDDGEPKVKRTKMSACFNCGGDHQLNSCPEPKNPQKIREAANEFKEKKRLSEAARYHDNGSSSQKQSNFRPGRVSRELRHALGIGPDDVPEWIYRMRRMGFVAGYPPGYLRQAVEVGQREDEILKFHLVEDDHQSETEEHGRESPPPVLNDRKMFYFLGFNQTYRQLNDRERNFRIPPFSDFCRYHQDDLTKKYWAGRKDRKRQKEVERRRQKIEAKELQEEGDVVCVRSDFDKDDDVVFIDRNPTEPEETSSNRNEEVKDIPLDQSNGSSNDESSSRPEYIGTPVMSRRSAGGLVQNSLPSLEAFSKGITPFKAEEESTPHRGFLKRIFAKIKSVATPKK